MGKNIERARGIAEYLGALGLTLKAG